MRHDMLRNRHHRKRVRRPAMNGSRRIRAEHLRHQAPCDGQWPAHAVPEPRARHDCARPTATNLPASASLRLAGQRCHRRHCDRGRWNQRTMPHPDDRAATRQRFAPERRRAKRATTHQVLPRPLPGTRPKPWHRNAARRGTPRSAVVLTGNCRALPLVVPTGPPAARLLPCAARLPEVLQCDLDEPRLGHTAPAVQVAIHVSDRFPAKPAIVCKAQLLSADHQIANLGHVFHRKADALPAQT